MAFTFQRDAVDPKYAMMAKFFANLGQSQREEAAAREKQKLDEQEFKRREALALVKLAFESGDYATADKLAKEAGLMQPSSDGYAGLGERLTQKKADEEKAKAAAEAAAKQQEIEQALSGVVNLQRAGQNNGFVNEGMSAETIDNPFMSMMTGRAQGTPVQMQTEREVFPGSEGLTPQEATAAAGTVYKLTPETLMAIRESRLSPQEQVRKLQMDSGLIQNADQAADTAVANRNAKTAERTASVNERNAAVSEKEFNLKKTTADALKTAAASGTLTPPEYENFSSLLDTVRTAIKPQVDSLAAGHAMATALQGGDGAVAQAAMVTFLKSLDESVAREREVADMIGSMGGVVKMRNDASRFATGKGDPVFIQKMQDLLSIVNAKNQALVDERLAGFDIQAKAAGPGVLSNYNEFKATIKGGKADLGTDRPTGGVGGSVGATVLKGRPGEFGN